MTPRRAASPENLHGRHLHWSQLSFKGQKPAAHSISKVCRSVIAAAANRGSPTGQEKEYERVTANQTGRAT
jgi:hypothetical protein